MKAKFNDHVITTRPVHTDAGQIASEGTHGFILQVLGDPDQRYVARSSTWAKIRISEETALTVLFPVDSDVA